MTPDLYVWLMARARNQDRVKTWRMMGMDAIMQETFGYALREQYLRDWIITERRNGCC